MDDELFKCFKNPELNNHLIATDYVLWTLKNHCPEWNDGDGELLVDVEWLDSKPCSIQTLMRHHADKRRIRYRKETDKWIEKFYVTDQNDGFLTVMSICAVLFSEGDKMISWERIVCLYSICGMLVEYYFNNKRFILVRDITHWLGSYTDDKLRNWIDYNNGWESGLLTLPS